MNGLVQRQAHETGFTLIELSIVLVIIGLIVGGILVGRDLITAATVRAQISQIEKFQQATNTFRGKYGALPGDIAPQDAAKFGFTARGIYAGEGDGNGTMEGIWVNGASGNGGYYPLTGETALFWVDLTSANGNNLNLIDGSFTTATATTIPTSLTPTGFAQYFPKAKIGENYVYVWSGGPYADFMNTPGPVANYFGIEKMVSATNFSVQATTGIPVNQAYAIDKKVDDGLPMSGVVIAMYVGVSTYPTWANMGAFPVNTLAFPSSSSSCFDNNNTSGVTDTYSVGYNNGQNTNCALSFKFQ